MRCGAGRQIGERASGAAAGARAPLSHSPSIGAGRGPSKFPRFVTFQGFASRKIFASFCSEGQPSQFHCETE